MSWNDGGKRDWDAFIATDESVDSELTDGHYGSSWKRVCLEGGQEDGGSGGIGDRGSPGFTVDDPLLGDQVVDMGDGEDAVGFGMGMNSSFSNAESRFPTDPPLDVDMDVEAGCSPTPEKSATPADGPYDCCFGMVCFSPTYTDAALLTTAPSPQAHRRGLLLVLMRPATMTPVR